LSIDFLEKVVEKWYQTLKMGKNCKKFSKKVAKKLKVFKKTTNLL